MCMWINPYGYMYISISVAMSPKLSKASTVNGVRVNQYTHLPLTPTYYPLLPASTFRFPPQCYVNINVTLAWYQQAGREVTESTLVLVESGYVNLP